MTARKKAPRGLGRVIYVRVTAGMHEAVKREAKRRATAEGKAVSAGDVVRAVIADMLDASSK